MIPSADLVGRFGVASFLQGTGVSCGMPFVVLYLVKDHGVPPSLAGLLMVTAFIGPLATTVTQRLTMRGVPRGLLVAAGTVWVGAGWLLYAVAPGPWLCVLASALFHCFVGTVSAQQTALTQEAALARGDQGFAGSVVARVRVGYTLGWIVGPVLGSLTWARFGFSTSFLFSAVFYGLSAVPLIGQIQSSIRRGTIKPPRATLPRELTRRRFEGAVVLVAIACGAALCTDTIRLLFVPVTLTGRVEDSATGPILSLAPFTELLLLPIVALLIRRFSPRVILSSAALSGMVAHSLFAFVPGAGAVVAGQILSAAMFASFVSVGPSYLMRLTPADAGIGSSAFFSAASVSGGFGALLGSAGAGLLGIPHVFLVSLLLISGCLAVLQLRVRLPERVRD